MKKLAEAMCTTCKRLMDVENHTKIVSAKEQFKSIMKMIRDAVLFLEIYQLKSRLSAFNSGFRVERTTHITVCL